MARTKQGAGRPAGGSELLRHLPAVERVLELEAVDRLARGASRDLVVTCVRRILGQVRSEIRGGSRSEAPSLSAIGSAVEDEVARMRTGGKVFVINGTGTLLHTNLGRARIPAEVAEYGARVARSCVDLEIDLEKGKRGNRFRHLQELLAMLTSGEDGILVNNNAAAVLLVINTLALGKEVIVSRGELIEIGGSFRLPDIIRSAGGRLVEVGTTNRTHRKDFEAAIGPETGLIMKTHTSNYRVMGFTRGVSSEELVDIGRRHRVPVFEDLGSGCLVDLRRFGIDPEPTVGEVVRSGVDVVSFSTDKLLGGPQGGIVVGSTATVQRLKKNHLLRALRVGKVDQAMVERTLSLYLEPERVTEVIPFYQALGRSLDYLESQAEKLRSLVSGQLQDERGTVPLEVRVERSTSCIGGGACPTVEIPGFSLQLRHETIPAMEIAARLRRQRPAILTRIQDDTVRIDMRSLMPEDLDLLVAGLARLVNGLRPAREG